MLQRLFDSLDELDGTWSRAQLEAMDASFTAAVEAAFELGLESRAAASATVRVGHRNGREAAIEGAIESAWRYLRTNMDAGIDVSFVEVVAFARERCSGVDQMRVRAGFEQRFKGERRRSTAT